MKQKSEQRAKLKSQKCELIFMKCNENQIPIGNDNPDMWIDSQSMIFYQKF